MRGASKSGNGRRYWTFIADDPTERKGEEKRRGEKGRRRVVGKSVDADGKSEKAIQERGSMKQRSW